MKVSSDLKSEYEHLDNMLRKRRVRGEFNSRVLASTSGPTLVIDDISACSFERFSQAWMQPLPLPAGSSAPTVSWTVHNYGFVPVRGRVVGAVDNAPLSRPSQQPEIIDIPANGSVSGSLWFFGAAPGSHKIILKFQTESGFSLVQSQSELVQKTIWKTVSEVSEPYLAGETTLLKSLWLWSVNMQAQYDQDGTLLEATGVSGDGYTREFKFWQPKSGAYRSQYWRYPTGQTKNKPFFTCDVSPIWVPIYGSTPGWVPSLRVEFIWWKDGVYPPQTYFEAQYLAKLDTSSTYVMGSVSTGWPGDTPVTKREIDGYAKDGIFYEVNHSGQQGPTAQFVPSDSLNLEPEFGGIWQELLFFEPLGAVTIKPFVGLQDPYPKGDWTLAKIKANGSKIFDSMLTIPKFLSCRLVLAWPWGTTACGVGLALSTIAHWIYYHRTNTPSPPSQGSGWVPPYGGGGSTSGGSSGSTSPGGAGVPILGTCGNDNDCPPGYACIGGNCLWVGGSGNQIDWGEE